MSGAGLVAVAAVIPLYALPRRAFMAQRVLPKTDAVLYGVVQIVVRRVARRRRCLARAQRFVPVLDATIPEGRFDREPSYATSTLWNRLDHA